jgi:hypothetical protein
MILNNKAKILKPVYVFEPGYRKEQLMVRVLPNMKECEILDALPTFLCANRCVVI